jgi:hypothetical protein
MPSIISAGTTSGTSLNFSADTTGNLVFTTQAGANTITVPNVTGTLALSVPPTITIYTSGSGTYTTPANAKWLHIRMVGGGGNGGTSAPTVTAGGGGGAGGYLEGLITTVSSTYSYAVGAAGGTTTFGTSLFTANAGSVGSSNSTAAQGGAGGTATGGYLNLTGANGGYGWSGAPYFSGGYGASSVFGAGGSGAGTNNGGGFSATTYGSGGGGGVGNGGGGNGFGGIIIITAYF